MYSAPITREHSTAFVLLVDQSGSMAERTVFADQQMSKARAVSLVVGSFIDELLHRARRDGGVRDYYDLAVIGYGGAANIDGAMGGVKDVASGVRSLVSPAGEWARPSRLAVSRVDSQSISRERLLPSGRSVVAVTEHNVWVPKRAEGPTPMCGALRAAAELVEGWCRKGAHRESYPPTVINITDGEASDGGEAEIRALAERIRSAGTADGAVLLVNIHLFRDGGSSCVGATFDPGFSSSFGSESVSGEVSKSILFPSSADELPLNRYARLLWDISSDMPSGRGRGVGYNCDFAAVAAMMNIGSINTPIV